MTPSQVPLFRIEVSSASARERGRAIGEALRERIAESVLSYEETFGHWTKLGWDRITRIACEFGPAIEAYDGEIFKEIVGMAEGASRPVGDLLAINARTEIMFGLGVPPGPECTALFVGKTMTGGGEVLLAQNWDWRPRASKTLTLIEVDQGGERPAFLMLAEAGLVGKTGFNRCGVGVTINAMISDIDSGGRMVPIHAVLRGILNSTTIESAVAAVIRARRGASATYTIASATGVGVSVEAGPGGIESVALVKPTNDALAHSNHFLADISFTDVGRERWPDSLHRLSVAERFLDGRQDLLSVDEVKSVLRDRSSSPGAICRDVDPSEHPVEQASTVASIIMNLTTRRCEITAGPPDVADYVSVTPRFAGSNGDSLTR